jgi:hypothetical protein
MNNTFKYAIIAFINQFDPTMLSGILGTIIYYLGFVKPIVTAIITFLLPFLTPLGELIKDFAQTVFSSLGAGDLTYYFLVALIILVVGFAFAVLSPGHDPIKKEKKKE